MQKQPVRPPNSRDIARHLGSIFDIAPRTTEKLADVGTHYDHSLSLELNVDKDAWFASDMVTTAVGRSTETA